MLENLDKIDWRNLNHAYGEASDVPELIRALAANDEEARRGAIYELYGNIWHQGTVYEATSYAVPFLVELLEGNGVQDKHEILILLFHLANGHSYREVHQSIQARFLGEEVVNSLQYQAEMQVELFWVKQAHDAVAAGLPVYFQLLNHGDQKTRICAPYTLSALAEHATVIIPIAQAHLETESDSQVRASLLLCIGILAAPQTGQHSLLFSAMLKAENEPALIKLAAAMALVMTKNSPPPLEAVQRLIETIAHPEEVEETYNALPWSSAGIVADMSMVLCNLEPEAASIALAPCLAALKKVTPYSALSLTNALLYFVFGRNPLQKGATVHDLTDVQKTVLTTIEACDQAWQINVNMSHIMEAFGLPGWRENLSKFLAGS